MQLIRMSLLADDSLLAAQKIFWQFSKLLFGIFWYFWKEILQAYLKVVFNVTFIKRFINDCETMTI